MPISYQPKSRLAGWGCSLRLPLVLILCLLFAWPALAGPPSRVNNSQGMEFVYIAPGSFMMGSSSADHAKLRDNYQAATGQPWGAGADAIIADELPAHNVTLTRGFYMQTTEVTNDQFAEFTRATGYRTQAEQEGFGYIWQGSQWQKEPGSNWQHPYGPNSNINGRGRHPVVQVSWNDAMAYIRWLSSKEGRQYRLPTEAEWEYACRGGREGTLYTWGDEMPPRQQVGNLTDEAFHRERPGFHYILGYDDGYAETAPVGSYLPNALGLFDMIGNVEEWCSDWYGENYYQTSPGVDPKGMDAGSYRVARGGSWISDPRDERSAYRDRGTPHYRCYGIGFRLVRDE